MEPVDIPPGALPPGWSAGGSGSGNAEQAQRQAQQQEEEERRRSILDQIMTPEARMRLNNIAMVKAEKARGVEDMLIKAATSGQLGAKVTEDQLIQMLEQVSSRTEKKTRVTIQRREYFHEDDSDDNDDDLM
ncbi:unnamed protein product [Discosporangium mesarthrocarpum]